MTPGDKTKPTEHLDIHVDTELLDYAVDQSFPASDPPALSVLVPHPPADDDATR